MRPPLVALALLAPALLAGCAEDGGRPGPGDDVAEASTEAPWWPVGSSWDIRFSRAGGAVQQVRMVNFLNGSDHFWLGVGERAAALDHALHDTNPFLGRVHWVLLAPHEGNRHAVMYKFPLQDGESYTSGNPFFGSEWNLRVDRVGERWVVVGTGADGATIEYDYDPATMWFRTLAIREPDGSPRLTADVVQTGEGARGAYWFIRGRDYLESRGGTGTSEERFEVPREEKEVAALAVEFALRYSGPVRIDVVDPSGAIRHTEQIAGGDVRKVVEIPNPTQGTWTVRYVGTGSPQGFLKVVGLLEYTATL